MDRSNLKKTVHKIINDQPVTDLHTHCYTPAFGSSPEPDGLLLWGIDELVTYHYLVAEVFRVVPATKLPYETFWQMTKQQQADHIWKHLFVENTPISEGCRGVITTLHKLGLDPNEKSLKNYRKWFSQQTADKYIDKVMEIANVDSITMTNPVFDDVEREKWLANPSIGDDPRFEAVLRIDPMLRNWPSAVNTMRQLGYEVNEDFSGNTINETRRFLGEWIDRQKAIYVAMSLPPEFQFPNPSNPAADRFIRDILMPLCADLGLPWAMMIGSRMQVNPSLKDAGDMVGKSDVLSVVHLCQEFPNNKFMVTLLSRENQHELCVAARKFGNLFLFGCWWFLNNPSIIEEMTRQRFELLGTSFVPQHSDARILDQLVYKWDHSRKIIANVLVEKYNDLIDVDYKVTPKMIKRDAALLLRDNFRNFVAR
ncbi:MAG: hypothetical protein JKX85_09280 [Phycisphaeraceae bacterium]|nr:hypothetical protein [Phycisphaeraceae bacterium]